MGGRVRAAGRCSLPARHAHVEGGLGPGLVDIKESTESGQDHMVLWEESSYPAALRRQRSRLLARTQLQDRHGRVAWLWRAPRRQRVLHRLGELAPSSLGFDDVPPPSSSSHGAGNPRRRRSAPLRARGRPRRPPRPAGTSPPRRPRSQGPHATPRPQIRPLPSSPPGQPVDARLSTPRCRARSQRVRGPAMTYCRRPLPGTDQQQQVAPGKRRRSP